MNHRVFSKAEKLGFIFLKVAQLIQESLHLVVLVLPNKFFSLYMINDIMGHSCLTQSQLFSRRNTFDLVVKLD